MQMTPEIQSAIHENPDEPVVLVDPDTGLSYVLVLSETYQKVRKLLDIREDDFASTSAVATSTAFQEGWEHESMDVYDALDPRKQP